ncbi:MAG: T9SS type A sorting domain-containing protein [Bacteroidales bacterium]|nr:T9SS type A sorting domain-containing protein [Bacteroidales bacterium]
MRIEVSKSGIIVFLVILSGIACSQDTPASMGLEPEAISLQEQFMLSRIPLLELPESYKGPNAPLVPVSVDNSTQPYFRTITTQSGYECGQSAGVAFNFTYETDRVRGIPANNANNQYPTHFVWDFLNNGYNYQGASFFDSWEIVKACGTMNVTDYGGSLNYGGEKRWISGYDAYYNGMKNRLNSVKAIRCDNPAGLQTLKYWLWDHLEGSSVGGVANFYAKYYSSVPTVFPAGTPEAGKYVQTAWSPSPSHAWTICGYNDSVRFDYNNDGQFTNTIDITGDGIVDMHDWEIGGLKFANGYSGLGWCNLGFCYMMYKTLADDIGYGGIWEHTAYVIDVKENCDPKLTMKITLKHTSRNALKVTVGMTTNLSSSIPDHVYEYPIFNHQGGAYFMQGGTSEADKTIEFGLDLTPVLSDLTSGQTAKYFLQVEETDPGNSFSGEIVQMALIDYTGTSPQTIPCASTPVTLVNNSNTRVSVNHNTAFNKPSITTGSLPTAQLYQPYSCQLMASGGTPPYLWDVKLDYPENLATATFPIVIAEQLTPTNSNTGYAIKTLDFPFPFYQRIIHTLYIYADGYILFDDMPYTYPYLIDPNLLFHQTAIISPFMTDLRLYYNLGDGIWYDGDANSATIRWKASVNNMSGSTTLNFAVKFYPNGLMEFYYGNMNYPINTKWTGGMSGGDNKNYQYSQLNNAGAITANTKNTFSACGYPVEMDLSENGVFSGTPQYAYSNQPINFRVTDNNGISNTKILSFTTNGLLIDYTINSGGDSLVEYGDTAYISFSLTNLGNQPITGVTTWLTESDPYITLMDSTQTIGTVAGGQTLNFLNAFKFCVSTIVPDHYPFELTFHEISNQQNFETTINLMALAPDIVVGTVSIADGDNGRLDPGETTEMLVAFENHGGAKIKNLHTILSSGDPLITVNQGSGTIPLLKPDSAQQVSFTVTASDLAPFEHLYRMDAQLSANNGFTGTDTIWLLSGEIVEDFETGTFFKFPWYFSGYANWNMDQFEPYEGLYAIKSGWISDDMESEILLTVNVLENGEISFWKRVSCEDDPNGTEFDYLAFFLDSQEMDRWDGTIPWVEVNYPVSKGPHTFKWVYHKDNSVSAFYDCCWIDFITLPPFEGALPEIEVTPYSLTKTLDQGETGTDEIVLTNVGGGLLNYSIQVFDTTYAKSDQTDNLGGSSLVCSQTSFVPGQEFSWTLTLTNSSPDNEYVKDLRIDFPADVTLNNATNFSGGSLGDLVWDGTTGNSVSVNWHGESGGGLGVIKPGESAVAVVAGSIGEESTFDVYMVYVMEGDHNGTNGHFAAGEIRVANEGLSNDWLSLSTNTGDLLNGESDFITVNYSAETVSSGGHFCNLLVRDLYNNIKIVPVHLHVNWPVGTQLEDGSSGNLTCFPNPFDQQTVIRYYLDGSTPLQLEIFNLRGEHIRTLVTADQETGMHQVIWDGTSDGGSRVMPGIYSIRMTTTQKSQTIKLILIR